MRKKSLKTLLLERLKSYGDFVPNWSIEEKSKSLGYLASTGTREVRRLVEEGLVEQKEMKGVAWYRYLLKEKKILTPQYTENGVQLTEKIIYD